MAASTYSELQSLVASYLRRGDLTSQIPDFIALAEKRMDRDMRLRTKDAIVRTTLSASTQFTTLPTGFRKMLNLEYQADPVVPLVPRSPQQMDDYRSAHSSGSPVYYCIHGTELEIVPVPEAAITLGIIYWQGVTALSDSNTSNWLLTAAPDIYLYASLVESAPFLRDDERIQLWEGLYNSRCDMYAASSEEDQAGGEPLVVTSGAIG